MSNEMLVNLDTFKTCFVASLARKLSCEAYKTCGLSRESPYVSSQYSFQEDIQGEFVHQIRVDEPG